MVSEGCGSLGNASTKQRGWFRAGACPGNASTRPARRSGPEIPAAMSALLFLLPLVSSGPARKVSVVWDRVETVWLGFEWLRLKLLHGREHPFSLFFPFQFWFHAPVFLIFYFFVDWDWLVWSVLLAPPPLGSWGGRGDPHGPCAFAGRGGVGPERTCGGPHDAFGANALRIEPLQVALPARVSPPRGHIFHISTSSPARRARRARTEFRLITTKLTTSHQSPHGYLRGIFYFE